LHELVEWLTGAGSDLRPRVVTGGPGSGKSAVLGRIVTLSDHRLRGQVPLADAAEGTVPPTGCVDVAVQATGKTVEQVATAISEALGIEPGSEQELVDALGDRPEAVVVVVDAVDEAAQPHELARKLLRPIGSASHVRLLVGTRRHLVPLLGAAAVVLDLDDPVYLERYDLAEYARRCLLVEGDPAAQSRYRDRPDVAVRVARAIADRGHPSFLVVQLASRSLANAADVVDVEQPGWSDRFPATVGEAMDDYLARFAVGGTREQEQRVRDLLLPLAYAQGHGLPDEELWAALATATGTQRYESHDVRSLCQTSAADLLHSVEADGVNFIRLFHEALADYFRSGRTEQDDHRAYTAALLDLIPPSVQHGGKDWSHASAYIRTHLAMHAAQAGMLDGLLVDAGFLLVAEPTRLVRELPAATTPAAIQAERVIQQATPYLLTTSPGDRASYLEMAARRSHVDWLASQLCELQPSRAWRIGWTHWRLPSPHRVLSAASGGVFGLAIIEVDGRSIVVSRDGHGLTRCWEIRTGEPVGDTLTGGPSSFALAVGRLDGRSVLIHPSPGDGQALEVWDIAERIEAREPLTLATNAPRSLAFFEMDGDPLIAVLDRENSLRLYNLHTDSLVHEFAQRDATWTRDLTIWDAGGELMALCESSDGLLMWNLTARHATEIALPSGAPVALGPTVDGKPTLIGGHGSTIRLWDLDTAQVVAEGPEEREWHIRELTALMADGRTFAVSGSTGGVVRVWDVDHMRPIGAPLLGHDGFIMRVGAVMADGQLLVVSGAYDGILRVWRVDPDAPPAALPDDQRFDTVALAVSEAAGVPVVLTVEPEGSIHMYHALDGKLESHLIEREADAEDGGQRNRYAWLNDRLITISIAEAKLSSPTEGNGAAPSDTVQRIAQVHDFLTGRLVGQFLTIDEPPGAQLAVLRSQDELLVVGARDNAVILWNKDNALSQHGPYTVGKSRLQSIALSHRHGQPVAIISDEDHAAWLLELVTGQLHGIVSPASTSRVFVSQLRSTVAIVFGGHAGKPVCVWDLETLDPMMDPLPHQGSPVYAVGTGTIRDRDVLVFGDGDGTLAVWDIEHRKVRTIKTGAMILSLALVDDERIVLGGPLGVTMLQLTNTFWAEAHQSPVVQEMLPAN
jgi:WD40 repeat protein